MKLTLSLQTSAHAPRLLGFSSNQASCAWRQDHRFSSFLIHHPGFAPLLLEILRGPDESPVNLSPSVHIAKLSSIKVRQTFSACCLVLSLFFFRNLRVFFAALLRRKKSQRFSRSQDYFVGRKFLIDLNVLKVVTTLCDLDFDSNHIGTREYQNPRYGGV